MAIDPVCGMQVDEQAAKPSSDFSGIKYFFCSAGCKKKFDANPAGYIGGHGAADTKQPSHVHHHAAKAPAASVDAAAPGAIYTCPMHPEIRQVGPGTCPICGMALEPLLATATEDTSELDDMTRRFWISAVLSLPLLVITMGEFVGLDLHHLLSANAFNWGQAVLATPVVLWGGWPFFVRAWASFKTWNLNMFSLIGIGTGAAYLFSLAGLLFPALLPEAFKMNGMVPLYFEAAAAIVTLVLMGQVLELRARSQTNSAIKSLLALAPNTAIRVNSAGSEEEVPLADVHAGDILRVKAGTKVPVDGAVTEGRSNIDESMLTGEPIPAERAHLLGLVSRLVEPGAALDEALRVARAVAEAAPLAVRASRAVALMADTTDDATLRRVAKARLDALLATEDAAEGLDAFAQKRAPVWKGR